VAVSPSPNQQITGRVVSVNPKGVKLDGHADWLNFSRFASDIVPPMRGQHVTLTLDRQGFVRAVQAVGDVGDAPSAIRAYGAPPAAKTDETGTAAGARDRSITRLAVLKAAAEFAAARPQVKSGEVLKIAASWERWVTRPADSTDTVDAF
jgi:hypothetical protein